MIDQRFVDDNHGWRPGSILLGEDTSVKQSDPHGRKIVGTHQTKIGPRPILGSGSRWTPFDLQTHDVPRSREGQNIDNASGLHRLHRPNPFEKLIVKSGLGLGLRVLRPGKIQSKCQNLRGIVTGIHPDEPHEALDQKAGGNENHESQGDLCNRDDASSSEVPKDPRAEGWSASTAFFQRLNQVDPGGSYRRCEAEEDRGDEGNPQCEPQDRQVHSDRFQTWYVTGIEGHQRLYSPVCHQKTHEPARQGKDQAFDEHLTDQSQPAGSHGSSHGDLLFAARGSRQEQIRHVGASDEEHETHCGKKNQKRRSRRADEPFLQRAEVDLHAPMTRVVLR